MKKFLTLLVLTLMLSDVGFSQTYQWTFVSTFPSPNPQANSMCAVDNNVLWVACATSGGATRVYRSINGGVNWSLRNTGLPAVNAYGIFALDSLNCWFGTDGASIYHTTNGGASWTNQLTVSGSFSDGIAFFTPTYGIWYADPTSASGQPYQLRVTTNAGLNWNLVPGAPVSTSDWGVINAWDYTDSNHVWLGSANTTPNSTFAKVFRTSTGYYGTWSNTQVPGLGGSTGCYYQAIAFINNTSGIVGSSGGNLKKTTDGGITFSDCAVPPGLGSSYAAMNANGTKDGSNIIRVGIDSGGVAKMYKTTNLGTSWINEPLPLQASANTIAHMRFIDQYHGFAVLGSANTPLGGLIKYSQVTGITPISGNIPVNFNLKQNYPNPFNPSTTIEFDLPKGDYVTLKVYNSLGKEVESLLSENMIPGNYKVTYDASKLSSGIYFYRLTTGSFSDTKKMSLIK